MLKGSASADDQSIDIEYQRGRLKAAQARTGTRVYRLPSIVKNEEIVLTNNYTAWQHPDVPIGFAKLKIAESVHRGNKKVEEQEHILVIQIEDFGLDAKSELPDNN
jgi:hypothetical protein